MNPNASLRQAQLLLQMARYGEARECIERVLTSDPDSAHAHGLLAICFVELGDADGALEEARASVRLAPDDPIGHYRLGWVLGRRGRLDDARRSLDEALRLDPTDPDFYELLGRLRLSLRQPGVARECAERGLALDPCHVGNLNVAALAHLEGRQPEAAEVALRIALEEDPLDVETRSNLGQTLLVLKRPHEARDHLREALRRDPQHGLSRHRFVEAERSRSWGYGWILPLLLKTDGWLGSDPIYGRFVLGFILLALIHSTATRPDSRMILVPTLLILGPILLAVLFARPLVNFLLRRDPLLQQSLSWLERTVSRTVALAIPWALAGAAALWLWGVRALVVMPVLSALGWIVTGAALLSRDSFQPPGRLLSLLGVSVVLWLGAIAAQLLGLMTTTKAVSVLHTLLLLLTVAATCIHVERSDGPTS